MKTLNNISFTHQHSCWLPVIGLLTLLLLSSCGGSSSDTPAITPINTLDNKIIVFGAQVDATGDFVMFVTGTDPNGNPLTLAQLKAANVSVDAVPYTDGDGSLTIEAVTAGAPVLSLSLVTDYSNSTNGELAFVESIFKELLDNLPAVFEAQVMTFSDAYQIQQGWTTDLTLLKTAVGSAHSVRNMTALYDSMGFALEANPGNADDGLIDRCRPAHMLVVFTDGDDNMSSVYAPAGLAALANADKTVVIMLGTSDAIPGVMTTLAGDYGAVVRVNDPSGLPVEVANWAASLNNMVQFTLDQTIDVTNKAVSITIGTQTVAVDRNLHCW